MLNLDDGASNAFCSRAVGITKSFIDFPAFGFLKVIPGAFVIVGDPVQSRNIGTDRFHRGQEASATKTDEIGDKRDQKLVVRRLAKNLFLEYSLYQLRGRRDHAQAPLSAQQARAEINVWCACDSQGERHNSRKVV